MRIGGTDITSRSTRQSVRAFTGLAVVDLVSGYLKINLEGLSLLGIELRADQVERISLVFLLFLFASYLVNWIADYFSLKNWTVGVGKTDVQIYFGGRTPLASKLGMYFEDWINAVERLDDGKEKDFESSIDRLRQETRRLQKSLIAGNIYAYCYFFGWYFAVPLTLLLMALTN